MQRSKRLAILNSARKIRYTSISTQDGVIGTGFTLLLETVKKSDKIYETMVFKTLDIRQ